MRIKKAVLLVLNNKTSGAFLSSNSVHATLNPIKVKGSVLTDSETVSSATRAFTDAYSQSDLISLTVFFNRLFEGDRFDELDIINITLSKAISDTLNLQDAIQLSQSKSFFDINLTDEQVQKNIAKVFGDIDASVERLTLDLNKQFIDVNQVNEILVKLFQKASQDNVTSDDIVSVTASKQFFDETNSIDSNFVSFTKNNAETNTFLESLIFTASKHLQDINIVSERVDKSLDKILTSALQTDDVSSIQTTKSQSDSVDLLELLTNAVSKAVNELNTKIESVVLNFAKDLKEGPLISDTPALSISKVTSDFFSIIDNIIVTLLKERTFSDSLLVQDLATKTLVKGLVDLGVTSETQRFEISSVKQDENSVLEQLIKLISKSLEQDVVSHSDSAALEIGKRNDDTTSRSEQIVKLFEKALETESSSLDISIKSLGKSLEDNLVSLDTLISSVDKSLQDFTNSNDFSINEFNKTLNDAISSQDNILLVIALSLLLADSVNSISEARLDFDKATSDIVNFSDTFEKLLTINRTFAETDFQDYTEDNTYFLEDYVQTGFSVKHPDLISFNANKQNADEVNFSDVIQLALASTTLLLDTFSQIETTTLSLNKVLENYTSVTESIKFNLTTQKYDILTTTDLSVNNIQKFISDNSSYIDTISINLFVGLLFTKTLSDLVQQFDNINISTNKGLEELNQLQNTGLLLSQNYVENGSAGYDAEGYFAEVYVDNSLKYFSEEYVEEGYLQDITGNYFAEDYVGESRILT